MEMTYVLGDDPCVTVYPTSFVAAFVAAFTSDSVMLFASTPLAVLLNTRVSLPFLIAGGLTSVLRSMLVAEGATDTREIRNVAVVNCELPSGNACPARGGFSCVPTFTF